MAYLQTMNEMILKSRNIDDEVFIKNIDIQKKLLLYLKMYKKLELNLETIFQMTLKIILLALVQSETRTTQGLLTLFEKKDLFGIPADIIVALSVTMGFVTFTLAQIDCVAGSRIYFPLKSRVLIGMSAFLACVKRILSMVIFFSTCLGLWNLLRHYQG